MMDNTFLDIIGSGLGIGVVFGFIFLYICFISLFLHVGAGIVRIQNRTFGKAILGTLGSGVCGTIVGGIIALFDPNVGALVGFLTAIVVIKLVYGTTFLKALGAYLMSAVVFFLLLFVIALVFVLIAAAIGNGANSVGS